MQRLLKLRNKIQQPIGTVKAFNESGPPDFDAWFVWLKSFLPFCSRFGLLSNIISRRKAAQSGHFGRTGCTLEIVSPVIGHFPTHGLREFSPTHVGGSWLSGAATHRTEDSHRGDSLAKQCEEPVYSASSCPLGHTAPAAGVVEAFLYSFRQVSRQSLAGLTRTFAEGKHFRENEVEWCDGH